MAKRLLTIILVGTSEIQCQPPAGAATWQFEAPRLFEQSVSQDLGLAEPRGEIELAVDGNEIGEHASSAG